MPELLVFIDGKPAGEVTADRGPTAQFRYLPEYLRTPFATPLSLRAPLDTAAHEIGAWLDGLLPDNVEVRRRWAARHNAASTRPIDLLATVVGLDCAGAVQFRRVDGDESSRAHRDAEQSAGSSVATRDSGIEWLTEAEIAEWIRRARQDWSLWHGLGRHGEFSLGGAQAKCALHRVGDRWGSPYGDTPTTHILKPGLHDRNAGDLIEHVCLSAARRLGIDAAESEICRFGDERVIAVTRFDRQQNGNRWRRLHQEDLCQALGVPPDMKYQADGGPAPADITALFRQESTDWRDDIRRFLDALIFNWAIAGSDAHAKNYSVRLDRGLVRMTPLYDLISYLPYGDGLPHWKMQTAMKTGGRDYSLRKANTPRAWTRLADQLGLDVAETVEQARLMMERTPAAVADAIDAMSPEDRQPREVYDLNRLVKVRAADVLKEFGALPESRRSVMTEADLPDDAGEAPAETEPTGAGGLEA